MKISRGVQAFIDLGSWDLLVEEIKSQSKVDCQYFLRLISDSPESPIPPSSFLSSSICWDYSKQGFSYWSDMYYKLTLHEIERRRKDENT